MKKLLMILLVIIMLPSALAIAAPTITVSPSTVEVSQGGDAYYNVKVTANEAGNYWVDGSWSGGSYSSSGALYLSAGQSYTWTIRLGVGNNYPSGSYSVTFSVANKWNAYGTLKVNPSQQSCTNDCSSGQMQCSGNGYRTCGNFDSDPCLEWSSVTSCSSNQQCISGYCVSNPNPPAIEVNPTSVSVQPNGRAEYSVKVTASESGNYWVDGSWQYGSSSSSSQVYLNAGQSYTWNIQLDVGNNVPVGDYQATFRVSNKWNAYGTLKVGANQSVCTSVCISGESVCDGNGYKTCGDYNNDGCTEWSSVTSCGSKQCANGGCQDYNVVNVSIKQTYILDSNNNFIISDSTPQKRQVNAGETINLFAEVEDTGISGNYTVNYRVVSDEAHKWDASDSWNISKGQSLFSWHAFKINENWQTGEYYYAVSVGPSSGASIYSKHFIFNITGKQSCTNICTSGEKRCSGQYGYEICGDYNQDGCTEWPTYTTPCPNGQSCQEGNCIQNPTCSEGWKCMDSSSLSYQYSNCSWGSDTACQYGCENSACKPQPKIICSRDSDCGSNEWMGSQYCNDMDVFQTYKSYACNNPGTASASCISHENSTKKEICDYGCVNNGCIVPDYIFVNASEARRMIALASSDPEFCRSILNDSLSCDEKKDYLEGLDKFFGTITKDEIVTFPAKAIFTHYARTTYTLIANDLSLVALDAGNGEYILASAGSMTFIKEQNDAARYLKEIGSLSPIFTAIGLTASVVHGAHLSNGSLENGLIYVGGGIATSLPIIGIPKLTNGVANWVLVQFGFHGQEKASALLHEMLSGDNWADCVFNLNSKSMQVCMNKGGQDVTDIYNESVGELGNAGGYFSDFLKYYMENRFAPQMGYLIDGKGTVKPDENALIKIKTKHIKSFFGAKVRLKMDVKDPDGEMKSLGEDELEFGVWEPGAIKEAEFHYKVPNKAGEYRLYAYYCYPDNCIWKEITQGTFIGTASSPGEECVIPEGCIVLQNEGPKNSLACADGFDNDNDGLIDMNDPGCQ